MLTAEERAKLSNFVNQGHSGAPYLRRARIVLLADQGATQEEIAAEVQVPITRVRQMLRAYNKEGTKLFPETIWSVAPFTADDPITDVARLIIADLVATLRQYETDLSSDANVTAVHETRKTTRKMRTALRLFAPYFEADLLRTFRRRARKFMRRLGRSRDIAVFSLKIDLFVAENDAAGRLTEEESQILRRLAGYWHGRQGLADERVRRYLETGKYQHLLADLTAFGQGAIGEPLPVGERIPVKTRHIAPVVIYEKLGNVRAMGDQLGDLQPERLHALRITCKELRYTLEFFQELLGPAVDECIDVVKRVLIHLGDVNDTRVHLKMLSEVQDPELVEACALYRVILDEQLRSLRDGFPTLWSEFQRQQWRDNLAAALAVL